jgi:hypothetical protein
MVMAGKRLVTAGLFAATLVVAATLWGAPNTTRAVAAHAVRQVQATVHADHGPAIMRDAWRSTTHSPAGVVPAVGVLIGLVLAGTALAARRRAAPVVARASRRERSPPARTDPDNRF